MDLSLRRAETIPLNDGRGRRILKAVSLQLALRSAILAIAFATAAHAEDKGTAAVSKQAVEAKIKYCEMCHQPSGQGFDLGYYPIPQLGGQWPDYTIRQLQAFDKGTRVNRIMLHVAHSLSPAMQEALADDFSDFTPKPFGGGAKDLVDAGKKIFEGGVVNNPNVAADKPPNVASCVSCHDPNAKGHGVFPRLAGQVPDYVVKTLTDWTKERHPDQISNQMVPVVQNLTAPEIRAVAAYLSYLH